MTSDSHCHLSRRLQDTLQPQPRHRHSDCPVSSLESSPIQMFHPRGPGALTDAHQKHDKMEIAFMIDKATKPFDISTPSHIPMPAARQLVPQLSSKNLSNVPRSISSANISAASDLSCPDSSKNTLVGNHGPSTYPDNSTSSTKPESAYPKRSQKLGSSCPPYSDEEKFSLMFFRHIKRWCWSRVLENFTELFPKQRRTEKGLSTLYYRTVKVWGMEQNSRDCKEKDHETVKRKAKKFSKEFLIKLGFSE
jgi:hypothetical protein